MSPTNSSRCGRLSQDLVCTVARSPPDFKPYCNPRLRVLFSVRSRYLFTIGLGEYLALAVDACRVDEGFPTPATLELPHSVLIFITGLSPCFMLRSRRLHEDGRLLRGSPNTTLPVRASVWAVSRSLAVSNDIALRFLFLSILRCFNSRGSPLRGAIVKGIPIRRSVVLRLRAAPYGFSQLGTSVIGFRAELSTRRHSSQFTIGCDSINYTSPVDAWIARTYGVMHTVGANRSACRPFLPTLARSSALVFVPHSSAVPHLRGSVRA